MWPMGLLLSVLLVWVLVVFLEEDVLSHPIRLEEVQDLIGRNGVEADLQERDECLARYYVGDQFRAALIYKRSENIEELKKEYEKVMEMIKQKPREKSKFWRYSRVIGGGVLVGGLAVAAAPLALSAAGFSTGGIVAGSLAARLMSMAAIANGGGVAAASAGGWIAAFQSAGAAGISASTNFLIGSTAGTLGGFFASRFGKRKTSKQGKFPDKSEGLPTGNRNDPRDNQTSSDPLLEESRKTTDLFVDIKQSNSLPTSKTESCSSLDSTDQNQDEEYLSADFQNISLNADEAEQLYRQNQQLQEEKQCKICLDSEMDTLFEPCGHLCTCRSCASMLRVCPICRKHIKKLHRVYRS